MMVMHGRYKAGTSYCDEKGGWLEPVEMWLVQNGILNLLSLPYLKKGGFRITYGILACWKVYYSDGQILRLKLDLDMCFCGSFPNLDIMEHKIMQLLCCRLYTQTL